ncbi:SRPBCC family protein [Terrabacter sp. NPDC000476]|uniref:SRPBCC family protein n=1 Tax=Terrabacter sp. NPDC000476 TaxID=3154258 RepID=UPI00332B7109
MALMARLEKRWEARRSGVEPISCEVSTMVAAPRDRVWAFLVHPRSAQLLDPAVVNAFRVPGTPVAAVGEQHCTVLRRGDVLAAHLTEVVAIDAPRSVAFRSLTVPGGFLAGYVLEDVHGGCRLTYRVEGHVAAREPGCCREVGPVERDGLPDDAPSRRGERRGPAPGAVTASPTLAAGFGEHDEEAPWPASHRPTTCRARSSST